VLSDPDNTTYDYNTSIPLVYSVSDIHLDSCWYTLNNGLTNATLTNCQDSTINVADETGHKLSLYANDSLGLLNTTSISFFVNTSAIETNVYRVQRGTLDVNGTGSSLITKTDDKKSFVLIDVRGNNNLPETLQFTARPASNRTAIIFENYNEQATVSWEYISGPGLSVQRGEREYNTTDLGLKVDVNELDLTESFIIVDNRLNSKFGDAYAKGLWTGQFINDTTFVLNRSQSGSAGNVSWQVIQWDQTIVQRGNVTLSGSETNTSLSTSVNKNNSVLFFSERLTDAGELIEELNASNDDIIWGSVSLGNINDTFSDNA